MSFLVDPPLLVATGAALGRSSLDDKGTRAAEATVLGVFLGTSISLYAEAPWTRPVWRLCRARSGRDWMINSGVFDFAYERPGTVTNAVAALAFSTYPMWLELGVRLGRAVRQRAEREQALREGARPLEARSA